MKYKVLWHKLIPMVTLGILLSCGLASAGLWGDIKGAVLSQVAQAAVAAVFFVLAIFFGVKVAKWKKVAQEGMDVAVAVYQATQDSSDGGKTVTKAEIEGILKEAGEFGVAILEAFGKKVD